MSVTDVPMRLLVGVLLVVHVSYACIAEDRENLVRIMDEKLLIFSDRHLNGTRHFHPSMYPFGFDAASVDCESEVCSGDSTGRCHDPVPSGFEGTLCSFHYRVVSKRNRVPASILEASLTEQQSRCQEQDGICAGIINYIPVMVVTNERVTDVPCHYEFKVHRQVVGFTCARKRNWI